MVHLYLSPWKAQEAQRLTRSVYVKSSIQTEPDYLTLVKGMSCRSSVAPGTRPRDLVRGVDLLLQQKRRPPVPFAFAGRIRMRFVKMWILVVRFRKADLSCVFTILKDLEVVWLTKLYDG